MAPRRRPSVAIGLPVYNGERYLSATLDCFLAQTFGDFELTVCDNASTDRTGEIAQAYQARDDRIRYHRNERNLGAIPNFNRTFALSSAPLFKWTAHDDLYEAAYLEACVSLLEHHPHAVLAHSATRFIDEKGAAFPVDPETDGFVDPKTQVLQFPDSPAIADHPSPVERFRQVLAHARWGSHMFGLMRRNALARTRLVPDFAGGDRAMLAELALLGRFVASPEPLFSKRFHENVSWALKQSELKRFMNTDGRVYLRRRRQLEAFFSAPWRSPVDPVSKLACTGLVALHTVKVAVAAAGGREARNAAQGRVWRRKAAVAS